MSELLGSSAIHVYPFALSIAINHSVEIARLLRPVSHTLFVEAQVNVKPNTCMRCGMSVYKKCTGELVHELPCWRASLHDRTWRRLGALPVIIDVLGRAHVVWHPEITVARRSVRLLRKRSPHVFLLKAMADSFYVIALFLLMPVSRHRTLSLRQIVRFYACKKTAGLRRLRT